MVDNPEIFGMHENANVTFNTNESLGLMQTASVPCLSRVVTSVDYQRHCLGDDCLSLASAKCTPQ